MSCVAPNVNIALAIGPVIIIPVMLFGGFFLDTRYVFIQWLAGVKINTIKTTFLFQF